MSLLVPNGSEDTMLQNILNKTAPQDLVLGLYSNNVTPAETDVVAGYTEVTGGGYANVTLTPASWTITPGNPTSAAYPQVVFTFTGPPGVSTVYGIFVKQLTSGKLLWAEKFADGPYTPSNNGDQIKVTPNFTLE